MKKILPILKHLLPFLIIFTLGIVVGYGYFTKTYKTPLQSKSQNKYTAFLGEVYDKIKDNYWDVITDGQLINIYQLGIQKFSGGTPSLIEKPKTKDQLTQELEGVLKNMNDTQKKEFSVNLASTVLASLNPAGRSGLFTQKQEEQLKNTVQNVNPEKDLYKDLGVAKGASSQQVADAYKKQKAELEPLKDSSPEAKKKLEAIAYAKDVLTKPDTKQRYDSVGVEPTASTRLIGPNTYYLKLDKFSPTSFDEFQKNVQSMDKEGGPTNLILDLRGNIGGAIDITPYFIGVFIGKNQYAFDFFHKGDYQPFRTAIDKLSVFNRLKQTVTLIDNQTQSSAEILAASLKRYHLGLVVGVASKGWGTVERVFPLENQIADNEKYSMFLVHSITIRDDGQPIEGRGVEPDVNIKNANWLDDLSARLKNPELVSAVSSVMK